MEDKNKDKPPHIPSDTNNNTSSSDSDGVGSSNDEKTNNTNSSSNNSSDELNNHQIIPDYKINVLRQVIQETRRIIDNAEKNLNDTNRFPLIDSYEFASLIEANLKHLKEVVMSPNFAVSTPNANAASSSSNNNNNSPPFDFNAYDISSDDDDDDSESSTATASSSTSATTSSSSSSEQEVIPKPKRGRPPKPPPEKCSKCGTQNTPEWRRGRDSAGNVIYLCNACGLGYAKQIRKDKEQKEREDKEQE